VELVVITVGALIVGVPLIVTVSAEASPSVVLPVEERVVNEPVDAVVAPIVAPSIAPPLISVVVKTELASVTIPVESAIEPAAVPSLALRFVTSMFVVSTVVALTVVILPVVAVAVVNVPAAGVTPPIVVPSIVPAVIAVPEPSVLFVKVCAVSLSTDLSAGYVTNTSFVPAAKLTAVPPVLDSKIVFLAKVVPEAVYVPIPTSHAPVAASTIV
jgi:hypothetical protein